MSFGNLDRDAKALLAILTAETFPAVRGPAGPEGQTGDLPDWGAAQQQAALAIAWRDLNSKVPDFRKLFDGSTSVATGTKANGASEGTAGPDTVAGTVEIPGRKGSTTAGRKVDVLVVCPLPKESLPALAAFDADALRREDENLDGHKIFYETVRNSEAEELRIAIAVIAKQRNVPAALATSKFINHMSPEAVILCGIGGGVKTKVGLGDVVVSQSLTDGAGGRREPARSRPRPNHFPIPHPIDRQIEYFLSAGYGRAEWQAAVRRGLETVIAMDRHSMPDEQELQEAGFKVQGGTIVAGEQLVADGSLPKHLKSDDQIRSCDMEGSGFGQACNDRRTQWVVFRGISDFGDPSKTDAWQGVAAYAAARAVRLFLETEFRLRSKIKDSEF